MLVLSNDEVGQLLTMQDCMDSLEKMYLDYAHDKALLTRRMDNLSPNSTPDAYYAFKTYGRHLAGRRYSGIEIEFGCHYSSGHGRKSTTGKAAACQWSVGRPGNVVQYRDWSVIGHVS